MGIVQPSTTLPDGLAGAFTSGCRRAESSREGFVWTASAACAAGLAAGLATGFWKSMDELESVRQVQRVFRPTMTQERRDALYSGWKRAVQRAMNWEEKA